MCSVTAFVYHIFQYLKEHDIKMNGKFLNHLTHADDIAIIAYSPIVSSSYYITNKGDTLGLEINTRQDNFGCGL